MNYNDITLKQWSELTKVSTREYEDDMMRSADIINIVFDMADSLELSPAEFEKKLKELNFLSDPIPDKKIAASYRINGTKYIFKANVFDMSMGQLIDWRNFSSKEDIDYAECLSVFLIPEGKTYNKGYSMEKTIEDLQHMSLPDAVKLWRFFTAALEMYITILTDYLKKEVKNTTPVQKREILEQIELLQEILTRNTTLFRMH